MPIEQSRIGRRIPATAKVERLAEHGDSDGVSPGLSQGTRAPKPSDILLFRSLGQSITVKVDLDMASRMVSALTSNLVTEAKTSETLEVSDTAYKISLDPDRVQMTTEEVLQKVLLTYPAQGVVDILRSSTYFISPPSRPDRLFVIAPSGANHSTLKEREGLKNVVMASNRVHRLDPTSTVKRFLDDVDALDSRSLLKKDFDSQYPLVPSEAGASDLYSGTAISDLSFVLKRSLDNVHPESSTPMQQSSLR
ncbi:uncharacterized protein I303_106564 [Kwoniella dejecticola CBS 10117]|uniref:Uncharacterized protein n=1 Tax=Kwoniella dejecticola CBS 10117 TaxID=1296121 RepID=A0A1A5ZUC3_9TREE|nr:uncharacterized protein I303_08179 [Kwoniella dejecticola CBS 10117]OBR81409.1 hypothetical protein I303_08179 [Kwoniella dejecticola CBS 10117]